MNIFNLILGITVCQSNLFGTLKIGNAVPIAVQTKQGSKMKAVSTLSFRKRRTAHQSDGYECDTDWHIRERSTTCYYFSTESKPWGDARDDCIERNAMLVLVKSEEVHDFLKGKLEPLKSEPIDPDDSCWIGLSWDKTGNRPNWKWVDGGLLTQKSNEWDWPWSEGNPNSNPEEKDYAVQMWVKSDYEWDDDEVQKSRIYVCQKDATNINECANNPCQNGGECVDGINKYTCTCQSGWIGIDCDQRDKSKDKWILIYGGENLNDKDVISMYEEESHTIICQMEGYMLHSINDNINVVLISNEQQASITSTNCTKHPAKNTGTSQSMQTVRIACHLALERSSRPKVLSCRRSSEPADLLETNSNVSAALQVYNYVLDDKASSLQCPDKWNLQQPVKLTCKTTLRRTTKPGGCTWLKGIGPEFLRATANQK